MDQNKDQNFSEVIICLLKGIVYKEEKPLLWETLETQQVAVRDYLSVIGLDVEIQESDCFAYLKNRETRDGEVQLPRLVASRPLSYPVSLILVMLRRKLTEHDAFSSEARLIIEKNDVFETLGAFFPASNNEVKILRRFDSYLQRIQELGFIRFLDKEKKKFEVKRILKAFVDAQWLADFDAKLEEYALYATNREIEEQDDE